MNNLKWAVFGLFAGLFSATTSLAQTDPKLHPGDSVKVTKMVMARKASGKAPGDSVMDVSIYYVKPDGSPGVLQMNNVGYSAKDPSHRAGHIRLEDDTMKEVSPEEVEEWIQSIIRNPSPEIIYFVDGVETPRASIMKLELGKIKTANVLHGDDAVEKFGEKARKGVIFFTTK